MESQKIKGSNATFGKPVDWDDSNASCQSLPVRALTLYPEELRIIESAWRPTEEELAALNAGHAVVLRIYGNGMPPVQLYVEEQ